MIRVFGAVAYDVMMNSPIPFIIRAAEIAGEADAERRVLAINDMSFASGVKLGLKYVDPTETEEDRKKRAAGPHYSPEPLAEYIEGVMKLARPQDYTPEAIQARKMEAMRRLSAEQDRLMRERRQGRG